MIIKDKISKEELENIFDNSLINVKPIEGNRSMEIQDPVIKRKAEEIIKKLLCS